MAYGFSMADAEKRMQERFKTIDTEYEGEERVEKLHEEKEDWIDTTHDLLGNGVITTTVMDDLLVWINHYFEIYI